ncbi:MAG: cytoplasmic protein [Syntrophaceae bacterium]|nr:cytoplasmic protein [Syntrophaceae bacterium]
MRNIVRQGLAVRKAPARKQAKQFDSLRATELYCPLCKRSMPVRERLLLVLPEGEKYEYLCARCGTSVGDRIAKEESKPLIVY